MSKCKYCLEELTDTLRSRTVCVECFQINEAYLVAKRQRYQAKRVQNGICLNCGKPNDSEFQKCDACREKLKEYSKKWYESNKDYANKKSLNYYYENKDYLRVKKREYYKKRKLEKEINGSFTR